MSITAKDFPAFGRQDAPEVPHFQQITDVYAWGPLVVVDDGVQVSVDALYLRRFERESSSRLKLQWFDHREHIIDAVKDARRMGDGVDVVCGDGRVVSFRPATDTDWPAPGGEPFIQWYNRENFSEW